MAEGDAATRPFGSWRSPITSDMIASASTGLSEVRLDGADVYWIEARPEEGGRNVVVCRRAGRSGSQDLTPRPFSVRTRVHEYGGGAWTIADGVLHFSNDGPGPERGLYRQGASGVPERLTPRPAGPGEEWRYADGVIDRRRQRWYGVREHHRAGRHQPANAIVAVDLGRPPDAGSVLAGDHDFFASPRLSPDGRRLAWLSWDHPDMPWVRTGLFVVELDGAGRPADEPRRIAGGAEELVFQPEWSPDGGALLFVSDRSGWWNLHRYDCGSGETEPLLPMAAEFGQPQWVFGLSTYAFAGPDRLVCAYVEDGLGRLAVLDLGSRALVPVATPYTEFSSVRADERQAVFRAGSPSIPPGIVRLDLETLSLEVLRKATDVADDPAIGRYLTTVRPVAFPTAGGGRAYGLYYPPHNPDVRPPDGEAPPLVVKCHGGPTAAASPTLDLRIQYWTSRGIAVLDVNYGGSTGYGRAYRNRLHRQWGVVDVEDAVAGARHLAGAGLADPDRTVITGGSAGGYTALAALTFTEVFAGGASHYGICDLAMLARDTHKFESRYLDWLIGPYPEDEATYRARSPLHHAERLSRPVVFFQGDEDMVVPPSQTEAMVAALRARGIPVGYFLFTGEQHGFRRAENIRRALDAELAFYAVAVFRTGLTF